MQQEKIVLGGGCFWCLEASFNLIEGVLDVVPGYAGGNTQNPNYNSIHLPGSKHAEVVKITFDNTVITLDNILDIFWAIHDPTTPNRQGADVGPAYRSIILYNNKEQQKIIQASIVNNQSNWKDPIVTEVMPLDLFYEAESEYHRYFEKHPYAAYCQAVINPKLKKLERRFAAQLKKSDIYY